jgi:hypothetical protein
VSEANAATGDLARRLAATPLLVRRGPFTLAAWPTARASAVSSGLLRTRDDVWLCLRDELEVTALLRDRALAELPAPLRSQRGWSLITLDATLDWDLVGVLAAVTAPLAAAGIPIAAWAAFSRDHLLVPYDRLDDALAALAGSCGPPKLVD